MSELNVIGKSVQRPDAHDKVTGGKHYPVNVNMPGMLHTKILRSPDEITGAPIEFLNDIHEGANYGWSQAFSRRDTYDELLASAKLNLVSDTNLRASLMSYYALSGRMRNRVQERETQYPTL